RKSIAECEHEVAHRIEAGRPGADPSSRFHASIELGARVAYLLYVLGTKSAARRGAVMRDSGTMRFGRFGWALAVAGLLLGSSGPARAAAKLPDLGVTALTNPPATALPGESFTVTATIKNQGAAVAPASTTKFSLSADGKTPTKDLKGVQSVPALQAGDVSALVATVAVGPGTPSGVYYLLACADGPALIPEGKEN